VDFCEFSFRTGKFGQTEFKRKTFAPHQRLGELYEMLFENIEAEKVIITLVFEKNNRPFLHRKWVKNVNSYTGNGSKSSKMVMIHNIDPLYENKKESRNQGFDLFIRRHRSFVICSGVGCRNERGSICCSFLRL
jgi:hypothetical protein